MSDYKKEFEKWYNNDKLDGELKEELLQIVDNEKEKEDRFYKDLEFGTAGLRGKLGAGINRMNDYVVMRATKALAKVILAHGEDKKDRGVAIAFDCRIKSQEFSRLCARVLASYGIKVYIFDTLRPTPELSYAVRYYNCISGINITASHNPKEYNGYKVYWEEGSQIKNNIADAVFGEISKIDIFEEADIISLEKGVESGLIEFIGKEVDEAYYNDVLSVSLSEDVDKDINIVYTPLNGTGNIPVREILKRKGYNKVYIVKEQEQPDGRFPTIAYPNPEDHEAFEYGEKLAKEVGADIILATDPDADRLAVEILEDGKVVSFNGNQIGVLLINYILENKAKKGELKSNSAIIKSIVTGEMGSAIAKKYGVKVFNVLTGFKNISELPNIWDKTKEYEYIFGYEESIGYNAGVFVRDKDAVSSALLLVEAAAYYKKRGKNLKQVLDELFKEYGYYAEDTVSIVLEGIEGQARIKRMMSSIREVYPKAINGVEVVKIIDYKASTEKTLSTEEVKYIDIEKTDAFECKLKDESWFTLRPSGTEPKIKLYIYTKGDSIEDAKNKVAIIEKEIKEILNGIA